MYRTYTKHTKEYVLVILLGKIVFFVRVYQMLDKLFVAIYNVVELDQDACIEIPQSTAETLSIINV